MNNKKIFSCISISVLTAAMLTTPYCAKGTENGQKNMFSVNCAENTEKNQSTPTTKDIAYDINSISLPQGKVSSSFTWQEAGDKATEGLDYTVDLNGDYTVFTALGLAKIANLSNNGYDFADKTVTLAEDINLLDADVAEYGIGTVNAVNSWIPINKFCGIFDGNGKAISNLYIYTADKNAGLFDTNSGTIKNLEISSGSIYISASSAKTFCVGAIAAFSDGIIEKSINRAAVTADVVSGNSTIYLGGICGYVSPTDDSVDISKIIYCQNYGEISKNGSSNSISYAGGITGYLYSGKVKGKSSLLSRCENNGNITSGTASSSYAGGIAGVSSGFFNDRPDLTATISDCKNVGLISGDSAGGIAGYNSKVSHILNSCNVSKVTATENAGGIVGKNSYSNAKITNCYNAGLISKAENKGGIVGISHDGSQVISYCYFLKSSANRAYGDDFSYGAIVEANCMSFKITDGSPTLDYRVYSTRDLTKALKAWVTEKNSTDYMSWKTDPSNDNLPTLAKGEISYPTPPSPVTNLVYDKTYHSLITKGISDYGEILYSLDDINYSTEIPTACDAGNYTVYYKVIGDIVHEDTPINTVNVSIAKKTLTSANASDISTYTYTGTEIIPGFKVTDGDTLFTPGTDFSVKYNNNINATENAKVVITMTHNNYEGEFKKTFTILPKTINTNIPLAAPNRKEVPQRDIDTDEYTATVVWSPEISDTCDEATGEIITGTFDQATAYTATVTITPKVNYTVNGVTANSYTLAGAQTVANAENSNTVTVVYPHTGEFVSGAARYTVTFDTNGGNLIENARVIRGNNLKKPSNPIKEGYTFDGWYTDSKLTHKYDFSSKVTNGFTLYAKWAKKGGSSSNDTTGGTDNTLNNGSTSTDNTEDNNNHIYDDDYNITFKDVNKDDWFYENVKFACKNNIFKGYTQDLFMPNQPITRAMLVTALYRLNGDTNIIKKDNITFIDIDKEAYYADAAVWAKENGITYGVTETEFAPNQNITREQISAMLLRYAKYIEGSIPKTDLNLDYKDSSDISDYALDSVKYCRQKNIMTGDTEGYFNPKDYTTRAEACAVLHRYLNREK